ncbi:hypothetical protein VF21_03347 [Pseudogymnoascus sp. 05NY08]|nr:hypothetical protein VF21_03347 [Pseudogymnoascus sp. 05NY08]
MQFSRPLKSSAHCLPSPDGAYIATIIQAKLIIRTTRSLQATRATPLPAAFSTSISNFIWSPSSQRILVSSDNTVRVFSAITPQYSATIASPTSETTKAVYISFGASHDEVIVFSDFGLKLTIFNLTTSTSIDIPAPKLFLPGNAAKGYGYRPRTQQLALLSRGSGKDVISLHSKETYKVFRSWNPDTIDAQALSWSPDGKWLAVIESAAQGHRILFYTADGHLFKAWTGPRPAADEKDIDCGAGVKTIEWSVDGRQLAVGDYSQRVTILSTANFSEAMRLDHSTTIKPDGIRIWQEQLTATPSGLERSYNLQTQVTCPPTSVSSTPAPEAKSGIVSLAIDASGTLIASRCENLPTTAFIWDSSSKILKAVLIQHSPIAKATWHPTINEVLLIRCEGEESKGVAYVWEPSWEEPKIVNFGSQLPEGKIMGKAVIRWLRTSDSGSPALFFSDTHDCILASISEAGATDVDLPWKDAEEKAVDIYGQLEESPLVLVPAEKGKATARQIMDNEPTITTFGALDDVDDTFHFKR